jgi:hypothetical protein
MQIYGIFFFVQKNDKILLVIKLFSILVSLFRMLEFLFLRYLIRLWDVQSLFSFYLDFLRWLLAFVPVDDSLNYIRTNILKCLSGNTFG